MCWITSVREQCLLFATSWKLVSNQIRLKKFSFTESINQWFFIPSGNLSLVSSIWIFSFSSIQSQLNLTLNHRTPVCLMSISFSLSFCEETKVMANWGFYSPTVLFQLNFNERSIFQIWVTESIVISPRKLLSGSILGTLSLFPYSLTEQSFIYLARDQAGYIALRSPSSPFTLYVDNCYVYHSAVLLNLTTCAGDNCLSSEITSL